MKHNLPTTTRRACLLAAVLALSGCYKPAPTAHARVQVAENGRVQLDGRDTRVGDLSAAVLAAKAADGGLVVEIHASPKAPIEVVQDVVAALKATHVAFGFASEGP